MQLLPLRRPDYRVVLLALTPILVTFLMVLLTIRQSNPAFPAISGVSHLSGTNAALRGQLDTIGATNEANPRIIADMSFNDSETSELFHAHNLTYVSTPSATSPSFSSGVSLLLALTAGKKVYGYKYSLHHAVEDAAKLAAETIPGAPVNYSTLYPGEFFASTAELEDGSSAMSTFMSQHSDVTVKTLSEVKLSPDALYLIIAEEDGISMTVRGLPTLPGISFTEAGTAPWTEQTLAIPKTQSSTDATSGFFAYVGQDMLHLSDNLLASTRLHSAPLGPVNYWWYPLYGNQETVRGYPVLTNVSFYPCLTDQSMHQCGTSETPSSVAVPRAGAFAWVASGDSGSWNTVSDGQPTSADLAAGPAVLTESGDYFRVRGTEVQRWKYDMWLRTGTLPEQGAAIVNQGKALYVLAPDGSRMYESDNGVLWGAHPVTGIDFTVRTQAFQSRNGHLWIAGRRNGEIQDRILVWPPLSQTSDPAYHLSLVSENTVNLDSDCSDRTDGRTWRLPSASEFEILAPALRALYDSKLTNSLFRIQAISGMYFPVMSMYGGEPQQSSNSDNLLCIADPLPDETKPVPDTTDCSVIREPTSLSGGQIRFLPSGSQIAVRLEDSCVNKVWDRTYQLQPTCSGAGCQTRTVTCINNAPADILTDCPSFCRDGVCSDPLENGVATVNSCPMRIGGHPFQTTVDGERTFVATDGQDGILRTSNGHYELQPIMGGWSPYSTLIVAPTPSGHDRAIVNQNGIEIIDLATGTVSQNIRGTISPLIALAGSTLFVAYDGRYWTIDTAKELSDTLTSTPIGIQGTVASRPAAMAAAASKLLITGRMQQGNTTMSGVSVIDTSSNTVISSSPLTGTPMRIAMNGTRAFILTRGADTVTVLDTISNALAATIPLPGKPTDIAFQGTKALLTTYSPQTGSTLVTIDTESMTIMNTLTVPLGLTRIRAVTGKAYLIGGNEIQQNSYVYVVDTVENNATTMLRFPEIIHALEVSGDDLFVLFQNYAAAVAGDPLRGQILVVDTRTDTAKNTCGG